MFGAIGELTPALTPSPWPDAPRLGEEDQPIDTAWGELATADDLDPWIVDNFDRLKGCLERLPAALRGESLVHWDIRADNTLITDAGRVVFVDWAWGRKAAAWVDVTIASLDLPLSGSTVDADRLLATHPLSRDVDPDDITALFVWLTGSLQLAMRRPEPPGVPTIRAYQRLVGDVILRLVKRRTGW